MKKIIFTVAGAWLLAAPGSVMALNPETEVLLALLEVKGVITAQAAKDFTKQVEERTARAEEKGHYHSVQGLARRLEKVEKAREEVPGWPSDKMQLSGIVEIEANYTNIDDGNTATQDTQESALTLAKTEVYLGMKINEHISGHLTFLYQEDAQENVTIDEGILSIRDGAQGPMYANVGKMVVPFGRYESHFITDPLTKTLGEANETALVVGYANDRFDISAGAFNGTINKTGKNDHINGWLGSAVFTLPQGVLPNVNLTAGGSYISNIADSTTLELLDAGGDNTINNFVGGFSVFGMISIMDKIFIEAEYLGATDYFPAGELTYKTDANFRPNAWNVELAYALMDNLEIAGRIAGSDDLDNQGDDDQYGVVISYGIWNNTSLAFEYLHGEMKNNSETDSATMQLAVEF